VRENAIWGLYIKHWTHAKDVYQTIGKMIYVVKEKIYTTKQTIEELPTPQHEFYAAGSYCI
jgi:hypothetical protein